MASQGHVNGLQRPQGQVQSPKTENQPGMPWARIRKLQTRVGLIRHKLQIKPSLNWSDVVDSFTGMNLELMRIIGDLKPILKLITVYPKMPMVAMLWASKFLSDLEVEETNMKEILLNQSRFTKTVHLLNSQRVTDFIYATYDFIIKIYADIYRLQTLERLVGPSIMEKFEVAKIAKQKKRAARTIYHHDGVYTICSHDEDRIFLDDHEETI